MSTSDSSQPSGQTPSQPSASATTPASTTPAAAAAGTPAAPASTDSGTPPAATPSAAAPSATEPAKADSGSATPPAAAATTPPATAPAGAPEKYDFKVPEGDAYKGLTLDADLISAMSPALKAANLTQDQANALVKTFIDYSMGTPKAQLARDLTATLKDPELGGMKWGETQGYVNEALGAFTTPEFRGKLERWGIANDLEFVRVFAAVGRAMRGDAPAHRSPSSVGEMSVADRIYGRAKKVGNSE